MKKILVFLFMICSLSILFSCEDFMDHTGKEYSITYISEGKVAVTDVTSYVSGQGCYLPALESSEYKEFLGWYSDAKFTGEPVTMIKTNEYGDKLFYAKWNTTEPEPEPEPIISLEGLNNYRIKVSFSSSTDEMTIFRDGNNYKIEIADENPSLLSFDGTLKYYLEFHNNWYYIEQSLGDQPFNAIGRFLFNLENIDVDKFVLEKDGTYSIDGKDVFPQDTSGFVLNFKFNSNGELEQLLFKLNDRVECTLKFSFFGSVKVEIPTAKLLEFTDSTIAGLSEFEDGELVSVSGYITSTDKELTYIADENYGLMILTDDNEAILNVGAEVSIDGILGILDDVPYLLMFDYEETDLDYDMPQAMTLDRMEELERFLSFPVNVKNLVVTELDEDNNEMTVSDNVVTAVVKLIVHPMNQELKVGSSINLLNVFPSYEEENVIINYTSSSSLEINKPVNPANPTHISANPTEVTVDNGTTLAEAMEKFTFFVYFDDETHRVLDSDEYTYVCNDYNENVKGDYVVLVSYSTFTVNVTIHVKEALAGLELLKSGTFDVLDDVCRANNVDRGMPSTGNVKALVVPVEFTDYSADPALATDLNTVLFGTSKDTGWESLTSYYEKVSYNKLHISGTITSTVSSGYSSSTADNKASKDDEFFESMLASILSKLDKTVNFSEYDSDGDGFIDAIYFIYTAPVNYDDNNSIYWAFTDHFYSTYTMDGVKPLYYFWAGSDFYHETPASGKSLIYNAETFIHETGHMLGLDDYYDYNGYSNGGSGGGTMMDYNVGDMDPYSKMILGWVEPLIYQGESFTYDLEKFNVKGECIIIPKKWTGTIFSEFYVLEYWTPDGLNEMESGYSGLFTVPGILIYHVNATLATRMDEPWSICKYSNASGSKYKLIVVYEADGNNSISKGNTTTNSDIFKAGTRFNGAKWHDKSSVGVTVDFGALGTTAKLTFTKN